MVQYATRYVSPRSRPLTEGEKFIRQVAYDLKIPTQAAIEIAAPLMAALLEREPCWLIPVPSSTGGTEANLALCRAIKFLIPEARIVVGIRRMRPVESSCARRRCGLLGLAVDEHAFLRCCGPLLRLPVWFIDNVVTTGATLKAAHLRAVKNLCVGALIEAVRDQTKTVGIKQVNAVLMQPHWRHNTRDEPAQPLVANNQKTKPK
jgi:hypothetical protein